MAWFSRVILLTVIFLGGCDVLDSKNKNSNLESLSISGGTLTPAFSPDVTNYTVTVDAATSSATVTATAQKGKALVAINGGSGTRQSATAEVALSVGPNSVSVVVTAEKRKRQTTYTIAVTRLTPTYTIGGTVSGLTGELTLQNNGGDDLAINADGDFTFATPIDDGSTYSVTVASQPAGQECTVTNGSGELAGADVTDVSVECVDLSFSVGGQLNGLTDGNSITLQNNGGDDLELTADGTFTFVTEVDNGADYDVTISTQPADQECTVSNGGGTVDGANVTNVIVDCGSLPVKQVAGVVTGLVGTAVVQLNGGSDQLLGRNGNFFFADQFTGGESYDVTVLTQPVNQTCTVSNGSGTIGAGNVLDVRIDCAGAGVATGSIFDWEWVQPLPQGNAIRDMVSGGAQVVAVGAYGHVQTSDDGQTWTTRDPGVSTDLTAVSFGNGVYVALGPNDGAILTSSDGADWEVQYLGFDRFFGLTWSGSQFVAVGYGFQTSTTFGAMAATSSDGISWAVHPIVLSNPQFLWDVAWNGSLYAALSISSNEIVTSPDGINWTSQAVGDASTRLRNIESDGSRFVAIGSNTEVYTSPDGIAWTLEANPLPRNSVSDLHWDGSRFVAVSSDQFLTSADGAEWVSNTVGTAGSATSSATVTRHSGLNIIGSNAGGIYTSPNDTGRTTTFSSDSEAMYGVGWDADGNQFVAVGTRQTIRTSPDGITWTTRNTGGSASLFGITRGGGQLVVVGHGSQALTSPDGITWTVQSLPAELSASTLQGVAWGNNLYVAVGGDKIVTSPDGETWTIQTTGLDGTEYFSDVAWNGSVWAVTGYQFDATTGVVLNSLWTSPDGVTWTSREVGIEDYDLLESIASNGSVFVATSFQSIVTSVDGINWSVMQTNAGAAASTWSGSEFVLAGWTGDVLSSTDGMSWSSERAITGGWGVASNGSTTVIISASGGSGWGLVTKRPPP